MMILIRFVLVSLIIYLIIRSFSGSSKKEKPSARVREPENGSNIKNKGVSKSVGEYVDYEELDK